MRRILFLLLFYLIELTVVAQSHPKTQELADSVAIVMCQCMNNTFLAIDEDVRYLLVNAISDPENGPAAIQNYIAQASEEKASEVMLQLQKLGSMDSELTLCFDGSTKKIQTLEVELGELPEDEQILVVLDFESEEKTIALLLNSMRKISDCELAYRFIKLGLDLKQK